jgi:hypothetical protein
MALKSKVEDRQEVYANYYHNWACTASGSPIIASTEYSYTNVSVNFKAIYLDVSTNNREERPWSNFSYRKVELWGNPGVEAALIDHTCWVDGGWDRYPVTYNNLPWQKVHRNTAYAANNGTGWEGFTYDPLSDECGNIALSKLVSSLQDIRTQWNMCVSLGEAKETAVHLARTASRLFHGFNSFRKGDIVGAYKHLAGRKPVPVRKERTHRRLKRRAKDGSLQDDVSSGWMEFSYAWMPLISDIDSAARYIAEKQIKSRFSVYQVSRKHAMELDQKKVLTSDYGINSYDLTHYNHFECNVKLSYEVVPNFLWTANTLDELGFKDPASLVWELLPLSFVVDWFINVGQVLESLHELKHWEVKRGIKSTKIVNKMGRELTRLPSNPNSLKSFPWNAGKWSTYKREISQSLPTAVPLRIKVDNPFDMTKGQMASAAVLLRYAFKQSTPKR